MLSGEIEKLKQEKSDTAKLNEEITNSHEISLSLAKEAEEKLQEQQKEYLTLYDSFRPISFSTPQKW